MSIPIPITISILGLWDGLELERASIGWALFTDFPPQAINTGSAGWDWRFLDESGLFSVLLSFTIFFELEQIGNVSSTLS
jgi:hypothetical protein